MEILVIAFILIVLLVVFGAYIALFVLTVYMARERGRSSIGWLLVAFFVSPLLAILLLLCLGDSYDLKFLKFRREEHYRRRYQSRMEY